MSKAVREAFIHDPFSEEIALGLNAIGAEQCPHKRNPCILRCGVRCQYEGGKREWRVIPKAERLQWLEGFSL